MDKLFDLSYWFNLRPGDLHSSAYIFFGVFVLIYVVIISLFRIVRKRKNNVYFKVWRNLNNLAITNLIIALFLLFFERETIYFLGARFWILFWLLEMIIWLGFIVRDIKKIPEIKEKHEREKEYKKYLP